MKIKSYLSENGVGLKIDLSRADGIFYLDSYKLDENSGEFFPDQSIKFSEGTTWNKFSSVSKYFVSLLTKGEITSVTKYV